MNDGVGDPTVASGNMPAALPTNSVNVRDPRSMVASTRRMTSETSVSMKGPHNIARAGVRTKLFQKRKDQKHESKMGKKESKLAKRWSKAVTMLIPEDEGMKEMLEDQHTFVIDDVSNLEAGVSFTDEKCREMVHRYNLTSKANWVRLSEMEIVDDARNIIVQGKPIVSTFSNTNFLLFAKVSKRESDEKKRTMTAHMEAVTKSLDMKPNVDRGNANGGASERYVIHGHRKEPQGDGLGVYSFKPNSKMTVKEAKGLNASIGALVADMEDVSMRNIPKRDRMAFGDIKREEGIPSVEESCGSLATQFSIGKNYWSPVHVDNDNFYTTLGGHGSVPGAILFYFVFPTYKVAVPMRAGDLLVFNPLVMHCCTNPTDTNNLIFSAYVSSKTVNTKVASNMNSK